MSQIKYKQPGEKLTFIAPSGGVVAGGFYVIGGIGVVALETKAETLEFVGAVEGVFSLTKVGSQAWAVGDKVYWDSGNSRFTTVSTVGPLMGVAAEVVGSGSGATTGAVRLDGVAHGTSEGLQPAIVHLTDSSGGSANDTIAAITQAANAGSADVGPVKDALADLAAKVNAILTTLEQAGILTP